MPIKVRCRACETVLNVSDKAAGRVVLCKSCGGKVKVPAPAGDQESPSRDSQARSSGGQPKRKRRPVADDDGSEDPWSGGDDGLGENLFGGINLDRIEDSKRNVCPSCAAPVHVDDVECPKCGVTIATGTLSERQRIMRARKGPPPDEFYKKVWSDGGAFLKKHWGYAVLTAVIWSTTLSMAFTCAYAHNWYIKTRAAALLESAKGESQGEIVGDKFVITIPKGGKAKYDDKLYTTGEVERIVTLPAPHVAPFTEPPALFWLGMTIVFQLGFGGWAWTLAVKIAELTMAGQKKIKRFQTDFFANLTTHLTWREIPRVGKPLNLDLCGTPLSAAALMVGLTFFAGVFEPTRAGGRAGSGVGATSSGPGACALGFSYATVSLALSLAGGSACGGASSPGSASPAGCSNTGASGSGASCAAARPPRAKQDRNT